MSKSPAPTLRGLVSALHEEMTTLRAELALQFKRIASIQAELDVLPQARKRRKTLRSFLLPPPSHNGDGPRHH